MENNEIVLKYKTVKLSELMGDDENLVKIALAVLNKSYAPYSNFNVGAALLFNTGEIVSSTNQESEVFPSGICAERSLLYFVQSNYNNRKIVAMAITSNAPDGRECFPCGACRQVMYDTEKRNASDIRIIIANREHAIIIERAKDLLPLTFQLK